MILESQRHWFLLNTVATTGILTMLGDVLLAWLWFLALAFLPRRGTLLALGAFELAQKRARQPRRP